MSLKLVFLLVAFFAFANAQLQDEELYKALKNIKDTLEQNPDVTLDSLTVKVICSGVKLTCKSVCPGAFDANDIAALGAAIDVVNKMMVKNGNINIDDNAVNALNGLQEMVGEYYLTLSDPRFDWCSLCTIATKICDALTI